MKTLLVCVGTGGIFYHGLSRMATFCHRRGDTEVILIDPNKIEEKNAARQWGTGIGEYKVHIARQVLISLGLTRNQALTSKIYDERTLVSAVGTSILSIKQIIVVCTSNHLCRVNVHEGCKELASATHPGVEVIEIIAGNSLERGYAYGCVHHRQNFMSQKNVGRVRTVCTGDWYERHPAILDKAGQSMTSNQLTALCVWDLAEIMIVEGVVGEILWSNIEEPAGSIDDSNTKYTKMWTNLRKRGQ